MITLSSEQEGTVYLPVEWVDITSTEWVNCTTTTEVATVTIPETTVSYKGSETRGSIVGGETGSTTGGKMISGGGRVEVEWESGVVVCLLVFCFSWGGVGGAF